MRLVVVAALAAACGSSSSPPPPDGIVSGSRLRAKFLQDGEGARQFQAFRDVERDEDCWFQEVDRDVGACLPPIYTTNAFADDQCTRPLVQTWPGDDPCGTAVPRYIGVVSSEPCEWHIARVWETGGRVTPTTVYWDDAGQCTPSLPVPEYAYHEAGTEVPLAAFVRAERARIDGPSRLDVLAWSGEDGSRIPDGIVDAELGGERCHFWGAGENGARCYPTELWASDYADAGCTTPVVALWDACVGVQELSAYAIEYHFTPCEPDRLTVWEMGAPITPTELYDLRWDTQECVLAAPSPQDAYYAVGAPLPESRFVAGERVVSQAGGRLKGYLRRSADGFELASSGLFDSERQEDCYPALVAAGEYRCLPNAIGVTRGLYYLDASCQQPLAVAEMWIGSCAATPPAPPALAIDSVPQDANGCTWYQRLYQVGSELASGSFYRLAGSCVPYSFDPAMQRYYRLGAEMPLDDFARLTEVTE